MERQIKHRSCQSAGNLRQSSCHRQEQESPCKASRVVQGFCSIWKPDPDNPGMLASRNGHQALPLIRSLASGHVTLSVLPGKRHALSLNPLSELILALANGTVESMMQQSFGKMLTVGFLQTLGFTSLKSLQLPSAAQQQSDAIPDQQKNCWAEPSPGR